MKRRFILVIALWFSAFWTVGVSTERTDFLIVLADDLGYGDLGSLWAKGGSHVAGMEMGAARTRANPVATLSREKKG